jgi:hypothetical protein
MTERVSIISGKLPILIVCPHGFDGDDKNTSVVAENIARNIGAYAVINRGWERSNEVDFMLDKANCNNVYHCHEDVVKEEFLEPIIRFKNRILQKNNELFIYHIHGMGDHHRKIVNDDSLDIVVGYGAGSPDSYTCKTWQKDLLCHLLHEAGVTAYEGKKGSAMSGWSRSNMNQLFRKWYPEPNVYSFQIEIIHELRSCKDMAIITAEAIANILKDMLEIKKF